LIGIRLFFYVVEGALGHEDSMENASSIAPGEVQRMSAGTDVTHSEFNRRGTGVRSADVTQLRLSPAPAVLRRL
jgi:redox-sensitive bicupin YhaK (pirin superfamily)